MLPSWCICLSSVVLLSADHEGKYNSLQLLIAWSCLSHIVPEQRLLYNLFLSSSFLCLYKKGCFKSHVGMNVDFQLTSGTEWPTLYVLSRLFQLSPANISSGLTGKRIINDHKFVQLNLLWFYSFVVFMKSIQVSASCSTPEWGINKGYLSVSMPLIQNRHFVSSVCLPWNIFLIKFFPSEAAMVLKKCRMFLWICLAHQKYIFSWRNDLISNLNWRIPTRPYVTHVYPEPFILLASHWACVLLRAQGRAGLNLVGFGNATVQY